MKRLALLLLFFTALLPLSSCARQQNAEELLGNFISAYSAEGTIYSPSRAEGEEGYVYEGLMKKIYVYEGDFPENYAVFLNSHTDFGAECAVFVCEDEDERAMVIDMCEERISLLAKGRENSFISRSDNIVFYSTMTNREEVEALWRKILAAHT